MSPSIRPHRLLAALLFIFCSSMAQEDSSHTSPAESAKLSATIFAVTGTEIQLTLTGDLLPNAGDKVDFFFKVPGLDDEVSVGSGTVLSADDTTATAKFEQGTGKPQAGQFARIHSQAPRKAGAPSSAPMPPIALNPATPACRNHCDLPQIPPRRPRMIRQRSRLPSPNN